MGELNQKSTVSAVGTYLYQQFYCFYQEQDVVSNTNIVSPPAGRQLTDTGSVSIERNEVNRNSSLRSRSRGQTIIDDPMYEYVWQTIIR